MTPILSTRFGKITSRIDASANIGKYLGIKFEKPVQVSESTAFETNKDTLIETAVEAVVQPAGSSGYRVTYDGRSSVRLGTASINYTVSYGDSAFGWANADHVEPDVTVQGRDEDSASNCAVAKRALAAGASIVNDVSAGRADEHCGQGLPGNIAPSRPSLF